MMMMMMRMMMMMKLLLVLVPTTTTSKMSLLHSETQSRPLHRIYEIYMRVCVYECVCAGKRIKRFHRFVTLKWESC